MTELENNFFLKLEINPRVFAQLHLLSSFLSFILKQGSWWAAQARTCSPAASASQSARLTGMCHHAQHDFAILKIIFNISIING